MELFGKNVQLASSLNAAVNNCHIYLHSLSFKFSFPSLGTTFSAFWVSFGLFFTPLHFPSFFTLKQSTIVRYHGTYSVDVTLWLQTVGIWAIFYDLIILECGTLFSQREGECSRATSLLQLCRKKLLLGQPLRPLYLFSLECWEVMPSSSHISLEEWFIN